MGKGLLRPASLLFGAVSLVFATVAVAAAQQATGTPRVYDITFSMEFLPTGGNPASDFVSIVSNQTVSIGSAAVAPGETAVTITVNVISPGPYNRIRSTLQCSMTVAGFVSFGGNNYITTGASNGTAAQTPAADPNAAAVSSTLSIADHPQGINLCPNGTSVVSDTNDQPMPIPEFTIGGSVQFAFGVTDSIHLFNAPGAPQIFPGGFQASLSILSTGP